MNMLNCRSPFQTLALGSECHVPIDHDEIHKCMTGEAPPTVMVGDFAVISNFDMLPTLDFQVKHVISCVEQRLGGRIPTFTNSPAVVSVYIRPKTTKAVSSMPEGYSLNWLVQKEAPQIDIDPMNPCVRSRKIEGMNKLWVPLTSDVSPFLGVVERSGHEFCYTRLNHKLTLWKNRDEGDEFAPAAVKTIDTLSVDEMLVHNCCLPYKLLRGTPTESSSVEFEVLLNVVFPSILGPAFLPKAYDPTGYDFGRWMLAHGTTEHETFTRKRRKLDSYRNNA